MTKLVIALTLATTLANAEEIRLKSGALDFGSNIALPSGPVRLEGKHFTFEGHARNGYLPAADCLYPCAPGETLSLDAYVGGTDLTGWASYGGLDFGDLGSAASYNGLYIDITGDMRIPGGRYVSPVTKTAKVRINADFYHLDGPTIFEEQLFGVGTATATFVRFGDDWIINSLSYEIGR